MSYNVRVYDHDTLPEEQRDFHNKYSSILEITDGEQKRYYSDSGEPEDNRFSRDYSWVSVELKRAYEAGKRAALPTPEPTHPPTSDGDK